MLVYVLFMNILVYVSPYLTNLNLKSKPYEFLKVIICIIGNVYIILKTYFYF